MRIKMIGIDHSVASIELREKFAFTKSKVIDALHKIRDNFNVEGVVILSTCNRSEIWLSNFEGDLSKIISSIYSIDSSKYRDVFVTRSGEGAVEHLFELTCGLKSKIIGEDQILTQVRESASLSRDEKTIDSILEKLFQMAVTSAKKVKTNIKLTPVDTSVATKTLDIINKTIDNPRVLVIGNGEIGKLTAGLLAENKMDVTMTLRQYKRGAAIIPNGCKVIQYDDRLSILDDVNVVVSATLSPHYTISYENMKNASIRDRLFIDLAMPRDIESSIKEIEGVRLYDVDSLSDSSENEALREQIKEARKIINKYIGEYKEFYFYRDLKKKKYEKKAGLNI